MSTRQYQVDGMSCGHCVQMVTKAIVAQDPAAKVDVDLSAGVVTVEAGLDDAAVIAALDEAGYDAEPKAA